jgi:hypothetical protein
MVLGPWQPRRAQHSHTTHSESSVLRGEVTFTADASGFLHLFLAWALGWPQHATVSRDAAAAQWACVQVHIARAAHQRCPSDVDEPPATD